jgi:23S rRNA (adenine2503-C2)-methyltransferase
MFNVKRVDSSDENVCKYVFTNDKVVAEAVLYKYPTYEERTVICCSTQSGCPVGCRFCGAGDYFVKSLTSEEIIEQVDFMLQDKNIDATEIKRLQIMFMSMGEPMLNYNHLDTAIRVLNNKYPQANLLISTSGPSVCYDKLIELSVAIDKVGLQFSVHESTNEARNLLVPFKSKLTLEGIALVGKDWHQQTGRRPFFNYCVHDNNNSDNDVNRLNSLYPPEIWEATLSVICERDEHVAAANQRQASLTSDFMDKMLQKGYSVRMFNPAGQDDIGGGCGQLWFVQDWMNSNLDKAKASVGFGLDKVHTPRL